MTRSRDRATGSDPLIDAYLSDLERALADVGPSDRAETLDAVREHIRTALDEDPTSAARVVQELGPVERVAAAAAATTREGREVEATGGRWKGSPVLLAGAIGSWFFVVIAPWVTVGVAAVVLGVAIYRLRTDGRHDRMLNAALLIAVLGILAGVTFALFLLEVTSSGTGGGPLPGVPD